jgi:endoglucanase Acf2
MAAVANGQAVISAGAGSYYASMPAGFEKPVDSAGNAAFPRTSPGFAGMPQTNEWWSSLIWQRDPANAYGSTMYPIPLAMRARSDGLDLAHVKTPVVFGTGYNFGLYDNQIAMRISVSGIGAATMLVDGAGDWSVAPKWTGNGRSLKLWLARGSPFVYADASGGDAEVRFNAAAGAANVWFNSGNVLGVTIGGTAYGLFAPAGAVWTVSGGVARSTMAGKGYFSVAALPAQDQAVLAMFASHAFAFVTGTRTNWSLDVASSRVAQTCTFQTTVREGSVGTPLVTMFRHQWLASETIPLPFSYTTARGEAKLAAASDVSASFDFGGIVPYFPATGAVDQARLWQLVNQVYLEGNLNPSGDSYGSGKAYGRIAQLIPLAEQCGHTAARDRFVAFLRDELTDWFRVGSSPPGGGTDAYASIQAESFGASSSGLSIGPSPTGQAVLGLTGGSWLKYPQVNFASGTPTRFLVNFASGTSGSGLFEARIDSLTGSVVAGGGVGSTGGTGNWVEVPLSVTTVGGATTGLHDVYLKITTPYSGELMRIDAFRFERSGGGSQDRCFAYDPNWKTLIAHPASFGLGSELNDHHFHYGYFIMAAATLARYDAAWASQYGPMVDLLIKDAANWDRSETRFPMLRNFDPYAGHSYASGHQSFFAGNNQESSSESMNFAAACFLWGAVTGRTEIRDLGAFLYAVEGDAIEQYWFDADNAVYPSGVQRKMAGIVWCYGAEYATWFSGNPWQIHGINFLPVTAASTYLGRRPDAIVKNWNILQASLTPAHTPVWLDIGFSALATANPAQADQLLAANPSYTPEAGDSRARTEHWIKTLRRVGIVDPAARASVPTYAAFRNGAVAHRFVWNPTSVPQIIRFNDGRQLVVAPGQVGYWQGQARPLSPSRIAVPTQ